MTTKTKAAHTPGPLIPIDDDESAANSTLYAAAPELLAAAEAAFCAEMANSGRGRKEKTMTTKTKAKLGRPTISIPPTPLARALRKLRGRRTLSEIATQVSVPRSTWHRWETGVAEPRIAALRLLCERQRVSLWSLLR